MKTNFVLGHNKSVRFGCICFAIGNFFCGMGISCNAAITFSNAPDEGRQIACAKVAELFQASPAPKAFSGLQFKDLTITNSHQMYSVGATDIVSGKLLSAAKPVGWRYLFNHGTDAVCEVPLNISPRDGKILKSGGVLMDKHRRLMRALQTAEKLPQVDKQDYEFRELSMGISFKAVWLHGESDDIIIPLPLTFGKMNAYQPYSENEIIKLLKSEAEENLNAPAKTVD